MHGQRASLFSYFPASDVSVTLIKDAFRNEISCNGFLFAENVSFTIENITNLCFYIYGFY